MSVLIYTETEKGIFKKNAFEVASYGVALAEQLGVDCVAVAINPSDASQLQSYGVPKILDIKEAKLDTFNAKAYATTIAQAAKEAHAQVVLVSSSADSKFLSPLLAAQLDASFAPNVVALPESTTPFVVKRTAFSNKGFAHTELTGSIKMIGVANNSFGLHEKETTSAIVA